MSADDEPMMLIYEHKTRGRHLVPGGVALLTEFDIIMLMSASASLNLPRASFQVADARTNPDIHMATKIIPAGATTIDLYKADFLRPEEKAAAADRAASTTTESTEAEGAWRVFLGYEWAGHGFEEFHILTPDWSGVAEPSIAAQRAEEESSEKSESEQDAVDSTVEGVSDRKEWNEDEDGEGAVSE